MATQAVQFRVDGKRVGGRMAIDPSGHARLEVPATIGEHTLVAELLEQQDGKWKKLAETPVMVVTVRAYVEGL